MAKVPGPIRASAANMHGTLSDAQRQVPGQGPRNFSGSRVSGDIPAGKRGELNAKQGLDEGIVPRLSPTKRKQQDIGVPSMAVMAQMREEDAFLEAVGEKLLIDNQTFTDRREQAGRDRLLGKTGVSAGRQRII